jgi:hypothetical protein
VIVRVAASGARDEARGRDTARDERLDHRVGARERERVVATLAPTHVSEHLDGLDHGDLQEDGRDLIQVGHRAIVDHHRPRREPEDLEDPDAEQLGVAAGKGRLAERIRRALVRDDEAHARAVVGHAARARGEARGRHAAREQTFTHDVGPRLRERGGVALAAPRRASDLDARVLRVREDHRRREVEIPRRDHGRSIERHARQLPRAREDDRARAVGTAVLVLVGVVGLGVCGTRVLRIRDPVAIGVAERHVLAGLLAGRVSHGRVAGLPAAGWLRVDHALLTRGRLASGLAWSGLAVRSAARSAREHDEADRPDRP